MKPGESFRSWNVTNPLDGFTFFGAGGSGTEGAAGIGIFFNVFRNQAKAGIADGATVYADTLDIDGINTGRDIVIGGPNNDTVLAGGGDDVHVASGDEGGDGMTLG